MKQLLAPLQKLGGAENSESVNACTTPLRLTVRAQDAVNADALKALGAVGLVRPSAAALQVVIGPVAEQIAGVMREALDHIPRGAALQLQRARQAHQRVRARRLLLPRSRTRAR